eukprot:13164987-Heterocapsa_arctica.AAC.1
MSRTGPTFLLSSKAQSLRTCLGLPLRHLRGRPRLDVLWLRTSTSTTTQIEFKQENAERAGTRAHA